MFFPAFHRILLFWWKEWLTSLGRPLWATPWPSLRGFIWISLMYNISNMRNEQQLGKWNFRMVSACQSFLLWSCELSYLWLSNQSLSSEQMWVIRYQPQTSFPDGNISSFVLRTIYPFPHKLGYAQEQYEQREQNQNICPIRFKGCGLCFMA